MGLLSGYTDGAMQIRDKLEKNEVGDSEDYFERGFSKVNKNLEGTLKELIQQAGQSQDMAFNRAVSQAVLSVTQSQQIILNALQRITSEVISTGKDVKDQGASTVKSGVSGMEKSISAQIAALATTVAKLPTQFPVQKETDLSPVINGLKQVNNAVKALPKSIPEVVFPKQLDFSKDIKSLEKKIDNRVFEFNIERDNELIKKVTVRTK
jgi:hypothetical protein